jgi:uncharacterized protein YqeY
MSLNEEISEQLKKAMLARDQPRVNGLRMIRAAFIELSKEGKGDVTEERCLEALRRLKKQREDSIEAYSSAKREDLADVERAELTIIESFLPQLADEAQTLVWVKEAIAASGASSAREMGKAMGVLMKVHKADVDAAVARKLLERELAG